MAEIPVGEYLFRRLKQMGIETAFGVPGGRYRRIFSLSHKLDFII
jgi:TPP-dependent 2-oxoacid decarboxylase